MGESGDPQAIMDIRLVLISVVSPFDSMCSNIPVLFNEYRTYFLRMIVEQNNLLQFSSAL